MTDAVEYDAELDASGLNCPLPLLKAKLELNRLASGAVLKVNWPGIPWCAKRKRPGSIATGCARPESPALKSLRIIDVQSVT